MQYEVLKKVFTNQLLLYSLQKIEAGLLKIYSQAVGMLARQDGQHLLVY